MVLRVLTISKPYVAAAYRDKLALLERRGGFEIGLICPEAWGSQAFEGTETRFWLRTLPILWNGKNHFHVYRHLAAAVRDFAPDILSVEEEHYSAVTWQAFRIARQVGAAPLFYTWQNIKKRYPPPFSWIERSVFAHAAAGIAGNTEAAAILRAKGYAGMIAEIPQMGIDLARFAPRDSTLAARRAEKVALALEAETFWLLFAGRLVEEKGVQDLLRALAALRDRPDIKLLVLGDGPYAPALRRLARDLGLEERLVFRAAVPSTEVPRYLRAVDVLCLPSHTRPNWKEQFGRVLIEAMAAEAVTLGSDSGEIPRVIADAGLVHPEGDVPAIVDAIRRLATDRELWERCRAAGHRRVRAHYTNEHVAEAFATVFEQVGRTQLRARAQLP